jgi:hypothetical protein
VYFNIRERADNEIWHKTYKQEPYKAKWYEAEDRKESAKVEPKKWEYVVQDYVDSKKVEPMFNVKDIEYNLSLLDFDDDNDFPSIVDEKPMCINCFHDLESDYFSNYYCKTCDNWFGEGEVLKYRG